MSRMASLTFPIGMIVPSYHKTSAVPEMLPQPIHVLLFPLPHIFMELEEFFSSKLNTSTAVWSEWCRTIVRCKGPVFYAFSIFLSDFWLRVAASHSNTWEKSQRDFSENLHEMNCSWIFHAFQISTDVCSTYDVWSWIAMTSLHCTFPCYWRNVHTFSLVYRGHFSAWSCKCKWFPNI